MATTGRNEASPHSKAWYKALTEAFQASLWMETSKREGNAFVQ